jgi:hypothetical protein
MSFIKCDVLLNGLQKCSAILSGNFTERSSSYTDEGLIVIEIGVGVIHN